VKYLEEKGSAEEKSASYVEAIATYLKLVDVLLVFADVVPTYPQWVKCTTSASNYQKKIKQLIALASLKQKQEEENSMKQQGSQEEIAIPVSKV